MRRGWGSLARIAIAVACAACGGTTTPESPSAAAPSVEPSQAPASAEPTTREKEGSAPPELAGLWSREYYAGEVLVMSLDGTRYTVSSGSSPVTGRIAVDGDRITFFDADVCDGEGSYTWTVDEAGLTLTPASDDPCGRAEFLPGVTWEAGP